MTVVTSGKWSYPPTVAAGVAPGRSPLDAVSVDGTPSSSNAARRGGWQRPLDFGFGWHLALWLAMAAATAIVLSVQPFPVAARGPLLSVAISTTAGLVGLALLQLGTLRFLIFGRPLDLFAGLGFGSLALAGLLVDVAGPLRGNAIFESADASGGFLLVAHGLAAALFLTGLLYTPRVLRADDCRRSFALRAGAGAAIGLFLAAVWFATRPGSVPALVDPRTRELLAVGTAVSGPLPGQTPLLVVANAIVAGVLLVAAVGFTGLWRYWSDPQVGWLAAALAMLFFSQLHQFLFPSLATDYVSTADAFRLAAYLVLLFSLVTRLTGEVAERASREERLRLSRDLHDGLAQQLVLLNLRLSRASSSERSTAARARDLEAAKRLVEAASLEARQAITALRTGRVTWEELTRTIGAFADEFAENHELDVRLKAEGSAQFVEAEVQAELLRILHESLSNALRHGDALRVEVVLRAQPTCLELSVHDDGRGFDPEAALAAAMGVGLRSMSERLDRRGGTLLLESAPGSGTTVRAQVPLRGQ